MGNIRWLWFPLLASLLSACGGGDDHTRNRSGSQVEAAGLVIAPVSADAPLLSVLLDAKLEDEEAGERLTDLAYGQTSSYRVRPGKVELTAQYAVPKGASLTKAFEAALEAFEMNTEKDIRYYIFIGGSYPDGESWVFDSPTTFDESASQARVTLMNAAPALPAADVHVVTTGTPIDSSTLVSSLAYREGDNSARLDPGSYQIKLTAADSTDVVYTSEEFVLEAGSDLLFTILDNAWTQGEPPVVLSRSTGAGSARVVFDADQGSAVGVVHASPDAGLLDVAMDDKFEQPLAQDLALGEKTAFQPISAGVHNYKVVPANTTSAARDVNHNAFNGIAWTLYLTKPWESIESWFISDNVRPIAAHARVRIVHGSTTAGGVDLYITEPGADLAAKNDDDSPVYRPVGELSLRQVTQYLPVEAGTYDVTFTRTVGSDEDPPASPEVVYGPLTVTFANGAIYNLLLRDEADMTVIHDWLDGEQPAGSTPE